MRIAGHFFATSHVHVATCAVLIAIMTVVTASVASGQANATVPGSVSASAQLQVSVVLHGPQIVKAGEDLEFVLTLDRAINFEGANVQVLITGPDPNFSAQHGIEIRPGVTVYHFRFRVPPAATGGTWAVSKVTFDSGAGKRIDLPFRRYTFEVIPNAGLTYPTRADIGVNPSQIQLLRTEAVSIQNRIRELKATLAETPGNQPLIGLLSRSVEESLAALQSTETRFRALSTDPQQSSAAQIFFNDLRRNYDVAASNLRQSSGSHGFGSAPLLVDFGPQAPMRAGGYPLISQGVLRALEQNEVAYTIVADAQSLTFDLVLSSTPQDASTALKLTGGNFKDSGQRTDCTIKALPYAIWTIRFEKQAYKTVEREHDPFREPNHVVNVVLTKQ